jgi:MoaA/NifB/PqqE/SkfB family radical SAM enzyme
MSKFKDHPLSFKEISDFLNKKKKEGLISVNFTGGEPTLYPEFENLLKLAKELKLKVYVNTNGERFADPAFAKKTAPFIDEICFSFHGADKKIHDFLMGKNGSFQKQLRGVKNLSTYPVKFFSNLVVNKFNSKYLERIAEFSFNKGIKELLISNIVPEGRGLENYSKLTIRLRDAKKIIPRLVKIADSKNKIIRFFGFPMCVLENYAVCSNDFFFDKRLYLERAFKNGKPILKEKKIFSPAYKRIRPTKCKICLYNKVCGGIFEEYYKNFGDEELEPIKNG